MSFAFERCRDLGERAAFATKRADAIDDGPLFVELDDDTSAFGIAIVGASPAERGRAEADTLSPEMPERLPRPLCSGFPFPLRHAGQHVEDKAAGRCPRVDRVAHREEREAIAEVSNITRAAATAAQQLSVLDRAVLAKAFCGELVPQEPNDEPVDAALAPLREGMAPARHEAARRTTKPKGTRSSVDGEAT